jgi:heavy metal sensor kinase
MFLKNLLKFRHTLALRLTLWYSGIFTASTMAAFLICYLVIVGVIQRAGDQELLSELTEFSALLSSKGIEEVRQTIVLESESEGVHQIFFRLLSPNGELLGTSNATFWSDLSVNRSSLQQLSKEDQPIWESVGLLQYHHKIRVLYGRIGPGVILQTAESLEEIEALQKILARIFGTASVLFVVAAAGFGWFMARRALSGVEEVTNIAQQISNGAIEQRVPVKIRDAEIDRLAHTFNRMLDRIQALVKGMREMNDHIAHDLRTPLTRIRGIAELALTSDLSLTEYEAMAAKTIEECDRLLEMTHTMLEISEAEAGATKLRNEEVDMVRLVTDAIELFQPIAEDKQIKLVSQLPQTGRLSGDKQRLQRLTANILDNALKYSFPGGQVRVVLENFEDRIILSIYDTGVGIAKEDLPRIFDRFFRCDHSRSQSGVGLGLSLAQAIARAHGGHITAQSVPGKGSAFIITLPHHHLS